MFEFFRAGGRAAAVFMLAIFFATPSTAAEVQAARVVQTFAVPAAAASTQLPAQPQAATGQPGQATYGAPVVQQPGAAVASPATFGAAVAQIPQSLSNLVLSFVDYGNQDAEQLCLAKTVYFEARGESLEGQLAVAEVVLNRAASGVYPATICGVVTQPSQFSFIRGGKFPSVRINDGCWHKALAIADIASKRLVRQTSPNVLWYHASYVAPRWGKRLTRYSQIGTHIFYS